MEIRGIDVSAWQGKIDWKTVADYGMGFAILRITEAGNVIDSYFEQNFSECRKYNIPVGAYKYSYAMTVAEIQSEARKVVEVLNGRKLQYPVWLDLEWNNQRSLGAEQIHKLAEAFEKIITAAGYKFGIYCNVDWYLNVICSHLKKYDFWIARYPASDNGTLQERLRPDFGVGWQYSSKAKIPGISGTVDRNIFYKDYNEAKDIKKENTVMTKSEAINVVLGIAEEEIGYLEKKNNSKLDSKTGNAGSANYTKYWRDIKPSYQGQPWCAAFISWCFMKAFGLDNAKKLLKHWPYVYCPTLGVLFVKNANPKVGDIVIFKYGGTFTHTGFVTKVRYLDNQRNMAEELFEGNIASEMTLGEAIVREILPEHPVSWQMVAGSARRVITTVTFQGQNSVHRTIQLFYLQIKMKQTRQQTQKEAATCLTQRQ